MDWVEFTKAIMPLAWPIAVVGLGWMFKGHLREFVTSLANRAISLKAGTFEATVAGSEQQNGQNPAKEELPSPTRALAPTSNPALNGIEQKLRSEADQIEKTEREAVLIRALAVSRLEGSHEFIYNRVFGSQIFTLKRINETGKYNICDIRRIYDTATNNFPHLYDNYEFEEWLNFLKLNSLISVNNSDVSITDIGRNFLIYITEKRLLENKPF